MYRVSIQWFALTMALVFSASTFAQVPASDPTAPPPATPPAAVPSTSPAPLPPAVPGESSGAMKAEDEKRMRGDRHRDNSQRKVEKENRKA